MTYWIFTITGDTAELKKRLSEKEWPLFQKTRHRTELKVGDLVLIYQGGRLGAKGFVASTKISSQLKMVGPQTFSVGLSEITSWKNPITIKEIINELGFIKRKDNWGIYFQGGISRIPKNDYETILTKTNS